MQDSICRMLLIGTYVITWFCSLVLINICMMQSCYISEGFVWLLDVKVLFDFRIWKFWLTFGFESFIWLLDLKVLYGMVFLLCCLILTSTCMTQKVICQWVSIDKYIEFQIYKPECQIYNFMVQIIPCQIFYLGVYS